MKLETHIHTKESSRCSDAPAEEAVQRYLRLGYDGMVITDHFAADLRRGRSWEKRIAKFLCGFHKAKEVAPENFSVLLGMELRFACENHNDYLVYGMDEEFLRAHRHIDRMNLKEFSQFAREQGLFLVQAHPFRKGITVVNPNYLDGMEVYNGHLGHDSRNPIAAQWAAMYKLAPLSGSDFHGGLTGDDNSAGGIVLPYPVSTSRELAQALHRGDYECLLPK